MSIRAWLVRQKIRRIFRPKKLRNAPAEERLARILAGFQGSEKTLPQPPAQITPASINMGDDAAPFRGEWIADPCAHDDRIIFYTHGGAYLWGSPKDYRYLAWQLSKACRARIFLLDYTLAPKAQCPVQIYQGLAAYDYVRAENPNASIIMAGDSAGGSLTVAMAIEIRNSGRRPAAALSLIAPGVDLTGSGESIKTNASKDVMLDPDAVSLAVKQYAGSLPLKDPKCSPLFANHEKLPPMLAQVGSDEILRDDSVRLKHSVRGSGGKFLLKIWPKMHHNWHMMSHVMPEARQAIAEIAAFLEKHWHADTKDTAK